MKQTRRGRATDPDVIKEIERLSIEGWSLSSIERELYKIDELAERVPERRTISKYMVTRQAVDPKDQWHLIDAGPEEARLVLPVLAEVLRVTDGRVRFISRAEAALIATLRAATDERMPAWNAYSFAVSWLSVAENRRDTLYHFDAQVALTDWSTSPPDTSSARHIAEKWALEQLAEIHAAAPTKEERS